MYDVTVCAFFAIYFVHILTFQPSSSIHWLPFEFYIRSFEGSFLTKPCQACPHTPFLLLIVSPYCIRLVPRIEHDTGVVNQTIPLCGSCSQLGASAGLDPAGALAEASDVVQDKCFLNRVVDRQDALHLIFGLLGARAEQPASGLQQIAGQGGFLPAKVAEMLLDDAPRF